MQSDSDLRALYYGQEAGADAARGSNGAGSPSANSSASTVSPSTAAVPGDGPSGAEQANRAALLQRRRELFSTSKRHPHTPLARHQARGLGTRIPDGPSLFRPQGRPSHGWGRDEPPRHGGGRDEPDRASSRGEVPAKLVHEWLDGPRAANGVAGWNAQRDLEVGNGGKGAGLADGRPALGNRADACGRERELEAMRAEVKRCKAEITVLGRDRACLQHEVQRLTNTLKEEQQTHQAVQREHRRRHEDLERMVQGHREQIRRLQGPLKHTAATVGSNAATGLGSARGLRGDASACLQTRDELECAGQEAPRPAPALPPRPAWLAAGVSGETRQPHAGSVGSERVHELSKSRDVIEGCGVTVVGTETGRAAGDPAEECQGVAGAHRVRTEGPMMIPIKELQIGRKRSVGSLPALGGGGGLAREERLQVENGRGAKTPRCAGERSTGVSGDGQDECRRASGFAFLSPSWWASFTGS